MAFPNSIAIDPESGDFWFVDERNQPCAEARAVAAAHLEDVQAKIADLKRMERVLKKVVAQCADGTLPECPLIETLFREGAVN